MQRLIERHTVTVDGHRIHTLQCGEGPAVLLLHGWPTNAQLYRHALPQIGRTNRAIAIDLPGFGRSDKPLDVSYSFPFYERFLDALLEELGVDTLGLAVHDLGGPIGLYWATRNASRVTRLAVLNTVVYAKMSWAVIAFVAASRIPGVRRVLSSQWGIGASLRLGMQRPEQLTEADYAHYTEPFRTRPARKALLKTAHSLHPGGFARIEAGLAELTMPTLLLFGDNDRILPDVARTMDRLEADLPHTERHVIRDCGHFLLEDAREEVAERLATFFADMG